jgi:hypothetical protein
MRAARQSGSAVLLRRFLLALIALLYVVSVPWYRNADAPMQIFLGLPDWVAVAILCYAGVAVLNSLAWMLTPVDDAAPLPPTLPESTRERSGRLDASAAGEERAAP